MANIIDALPAETFSRAEKWNRAKLESAALHLPLDQQEVLCDAASSKSHKRRKVKGIVLRSTSPPLPKAMDNELPTFFETVSQERCNTDYFHRSEKSSTKTMPSFLQVNRERVHAALRWLKEHNPLYRNIVISAERLCTLPEDAIPEDLLAIAKHSVDNELLAQENDNYMPEHDSDADGEGMSSWLLVWPHLRGIHFSGDTDTEVDSDLDDSEDCPPCPVVSEPESIPLRSLGVVDVAACDVTENEMLASALANVARTDKMEGWAVKRSSDFVNEYPRRTADGACYEGSPENLNHLLGSFPCLFPYGEGGYEIDRLSPVSYDAHVFGVLQKRQLCAAAGLQIARSTFFTS
ncbi:hypothetical protein EI94DRAFT_1695495 [Lactarius quietus]|nr:hypothetical protein EI94DRAFT_1695495 [Lactarius quietus]